MNLLDGFLSSAARFPSRPALRLGGESYDYRELAARASRVGASISETDDGGAPCVGVLAQRSLSAYVGVLGALWAGRTYVPLHPGFPPRRNASMCRRSGLRTLVVGCEGLEALRALLARTQEAFDLLLPEVGELPAWAQADSPHRFRTGGQLAPGADPTAPTDFAYLLFTSGSTGEPKGVPVAHSNAGAYVAAAGSRYAVTERDRLSQVFDLTFDLSVHDMFVAWGYGACLCIPSPRAVMAPARFIRDEHLTLWFSVPSTLGRMLDMRMLRAGAFPSLRLSLFCGEPLPAHYAEAWQRAAPDSIVENLYGPTEATIAITRYRWDAARSPQECVHGIVPIGRAFEGQRTCLIDAQGHVLPPGSEGELCLAGSQVTQGYLDDEAQTAAHFIALPDTAATRWYRTGDLVREDEGGCLHFVGRIDDQVKIRGFRVELAEIEHALREATEGSTAVAVAWPLRHGTADGIVGFIQTPDAIDEEKVIARCKELLPPYMLPAGLRLVTRLPLNPNGKIDRKALLRRLESE